MKKKLILSMFVLIMILMVCGCDINLNNENNENTSIKNKYNNLVTLKDSKLRDNFIDACKQINMDVSDVNKLKQIEDWNSGPRYSFYYKNVQFILYAYDSGEISSITISNGNLDKIYLEGFEPYDVNDYLLSADKITDLQLSAESGIKSKLNYPNTAKFKWLTSGGYSKRGDVYIVTGEFEAKNAFGVENTSKFYIEEQIKNGNYNVVYMTIDGKKYIGTESKIKNNSRKEIIQDNTTKNNNSTEIVLNEGQKGTYGKEDLFDGEKYIRYYIPAGDYEVEALTKNASFFIEEIKIHKENGYDTATSIKKVSLSKVGDKDIISIKSDQCISLVINTKVKLVKLN